MDPTRSNHQQQASTSSSTSSMSTSNGSSSSDNNVSTYEVRCTSSDEPAFVARVSWPSGARLPRPGSGQRDGKIRQFKPHFKARPVDKTAIILDKLPWIELAQYISGVAESVKPATVEWADELEPLQVCLYISDDSVAQKRHGWFLDIAGHRLRARPLTEPPLVRVLVTNALPIIDNETIAWHLSRYGIQVKEWVNLEAVPSPDPLTKPWHNVLSFARYLYVEPRDIPKFPAKIHGTAGTTLYTIYFGSEDHWCDFCHRVGHYEWSCAKQQMARSIGLNQRTTTTTTTPTPPVVRVTAPPTVENNDASLPRSAPSTASSSPRRNLGVFFDDTNQTTSPTSKTSVAAAAAEINGVDQLAPPCTPPQQLVAPGDNVLGAFGLRLTFSPSKDKKSPGQIKSIQAVPLSPNQNSPVSASMASLLSSPLGSTLSLPTAAAAASPVVDHVDGAAAAAAAASAVAAAESAAASAAAAESAAASAAESAAAAAEATSPSASVEQLPTFFPLSPRKNSSASTSSNPSCTSSLKKRIRGRQKGKNKKNKKSSVSPSTHLYTKASEKKKTVAVQPGPSGASTSEIQPAPLQTTSSPSKAADASVAAAAPRSPRTDTSNDSSTNPQIVGAIELHPPPATEGPQTIEESTARHELPVELVQPGEENSPRSSHPSPERPDPRGRGQLAAAAAAPSSPSNSNSSPAAEAAAAETETSNDRPSSGGNKKGKRILAVLQNLI